ncbi:EXS, C-terminal [Cynara cardunculus var. scolymus]|uniref:EXS, C-terminal n=1 Tax=Cynara cardunculus var. scolymus TaxID=59895 RepID=A0A103XSP9_CYNCS|nr:EXS, C-terminal [Cynara cardunculus var. scolymus]
MKFGKELKQEKVPEWTEAYMDYNGLKRILQEIQQFKQHERPPSPLRTSQKRLPLYRPFSGVDVRASFEESTSDVEDRVIAVETVKEDDTREVYSTNILMSPKGGGQSEITFFQKLDEELNKVNTFYRDKVEEVIEEAASLNKQMKALIALQIKVEPPDIDECHIQRNRSMDSGSESSKFTSPSRVEMLGERHLVEEHQIEMNNWKQLKGSSAYPTEDRHMDSKFDVDRINHCGPGESGSPVNRGASINSAACGNGPSSDKYKSDPLDVLDHVKINNTLESPMSTIRSVLNDSKDKDLSFTKEELKEAEGRLKVAFIEFYRKLHLLKHYRCYVNLLAFSKIMKKYEKIALRRAARSYMKIVDESYIGSSDELPFTELAELDEAVTSFLRRILFWLLNRSPDCRGLTNTSKESNGQRGAYHVYGKCFPSLQVVLAIFSCPFNIFYKSSRFFLIRCVLRCICAPLYKVSLADFFLADQLTSQVQALRCIEFYICYYGMRWYQKEEKCHSLDLYNFFYIIVAVIPFWIRFLQCVRRLFEEKDWMHLCNGSRYFLTIIAVVVRTVFELKMDRTWKVLALVSSVAAILFNTYWDIVVDWGLLQRNSKNLFLRDKLAVSRRSVYFVVMVLDVILRLTWLQLVLKFNLRSLKGTAISSLFSCLEIFRRGVWMFFRLENEHLNNVGKYRAFKSVPLPFSYYEEDDDNKDD